MFTRSFKIIHSELKIADVESLTSQDVKLYSTLSNLKVLCNSVTIFVDGTLNSCPKLYHQLVTVHYTINYSYVPFIYIFLFSKITQCYLQAFQYLVLECKKYN